jgi:VWFA-related protein
MRKILSAGLLLLAFSAAVANAQEIRTEEKITVERIVIDARIIESSGDPILGLTPSDLRVLVDGLPAEIETVEWIASDEAWAEGLTPQQVEGTHYSVAPEGRLIVLFFQTDFQRQRVKGQMKMSLYAIDFLETLDPRDRVAVVSFDSHLKLRQDFTNDREKLRHAIRESIRIDSPPSPSLSPNPSLFARIDPIEARKAATSEKALYLVGNALNPVPGSKSLVLFGWGLGDYFAKHVTMIRDYALAKAALEASRTSVFSLDISDADYHSLEIGLNRAAKDTGGFYEKTHIFPGFAMDKLRRTISGRYEIVVKRPEGLEPGLHSVNVRLVGRRGEVLARKTFSD